MYNVLWLSIIDLSADHVSLVQEVQHNFHAKDKSVRYWNKSTLGEIRERVRDMWWKQWKKVMIEYLFDIESQKSCVHKEQTAVSMWMEKIYD